MSKAGYGTLSISDLLAANFQTVAQIGEDKVFDSINATLQAHNEIVRKEVIPFFATVTTDRLRRFGGNAESDMTEVDELGTPGPQKIATGVTCGFPLRHYAYGIQWTRDYLRKAKANEVAVQFVAALSADIRNISKRIRDALFKNTNNLTYVDRLTDTVVLPLRALVNADGADIPAGPYGTTFDPSTHTHYSTAATLNDSALDALVTLPLEHSTQAKIVVFINRAQEATVRALTNFHAYTDARLLQSVDSVRTLTPLDVTNLYDRAIGIYGASEIWVKPWVPSGYLIALDTTPGNQPLVIRVREGEGFGDYELEADDESHPLRGQVFGREFGVGVWNRTSAAILQITGGSYVIPTLTT